MQRTIRRLALSTFAGLALSALAAAPAMATSVITEHASSVKATSAFLHGVIDTGGVATTWQFQYGKTTAYSSGTPVKTIPAGQGNVPVSWEVTHLSPNTVYHFRLVATTSSGNTAYPVAVTRGRDLTFRTKTTGRLLLDATRLFVTNGVVSVPFTCDSSVACKSRFSITTRTRIAKGKKLATIDCAVTKPAFTIAKHKQKTVSAQVRPACMTLLDKSRDRRIIAKLTSNPSATGQKAVIRTVILILS